MTEHWSRSARARLPLRLKRPFRGRLQWRKPLLVGAGALAVGTFGWTLYSSAGWLGTSAPSSVSRTEVPPAAAAKAVVSLPAPDLLRPDSPKKARLRTRTALHQPTDSPAGKFVLKSAADDADRALTCLTQAVYYEAAGEGTDGGRAVADRPQPYAAPRIPRQCLRRGLPGVGALYGLPVHLYLRRVPSSPAGGIAVEPFQKNRSGGIGRQGLRAGGACHALSC